MLPPPPGTLYFLLNAQNRLNSRTAFTDCRQSVDHSKPSYDSNINLNDILKTLALQYLTFIKDHTENPH